MTTYNSQYNHNLVNKSPNMSTYNNGSAVVSSSANQKTYGNMNSRSVNYNYHNHNSQQRYYQNMSSTNLQSSSHNYNNYTQHSGTSPYSYPNAMVSPQYTYSGSQTSVTTPKSRQTKQRANKTKPKIKIGRSKLGYDIPLANTLSTRKKLQDILGASFDDYWTVFSQFIRAQLSKMELDTYVTGILGVNNLYLHNQLVLSILQNARSQYNFPDEAKFLSPEVQAKARQKQRQPRRQTSNNSTQKRYRSNKVNSTNSRSLKRKTPTPSSMTQTQIQLQNAQQVAKKRHIAMIPLASSLLPVRPEVNQFQFPHRAIQHLISLGQFGRRIAANEISLSTSNRKDIPLPKSNTLAASRVRYLRKLHKLNPTVLYNHLSIVHNAYFYNLQRPRVRSVGPYTSRGTMMEKQSLELLRRQISNGNQTILWTGKRLSVPWDELRKTKFRDKARHLGLGMGYSDILGAEDENDGGIHRLEAPLVPGEEKGHYNVTNDEWINDQRHRQALVGPNNHIPHDNIRWPGQMGRLPAAKIILAKLNQYSQLSKIQFDAATSAPVVQAIYEASEKYVSQVIVKLLDSAHNDRAISLMSSYAQKPPSESKWADEDLKFTHNDTIALEWHKRKQRSDDELTPLRKDHVWPSVLRLTDVVEPSKEFLPPPLKRTRLETAITRINNIET